MERFVGFDVGKKRIGVAVSDPLGITAQPLKVVERNGQGSEWTSLKEVVDEYAPILAVIGLPLHMNGTEGEQAEAARLFAKTFSRKHPDIRVIFQDERFTTAASERMLIEAGVSRAARRKKRDVIAATLILQTFLDSMKTR
ncbi:Holliday junction resolvase RuvX [Candidatus Sumerlaeota bacterium]|nr:Holliday junction resolvase RuvX [Candidatus Sumerlaeota bacterium]